MRKLKEQKLNDILLLLLYILGSIIAMVVVSKALFGFIGEILSYNTPVNAQTQTNTANSS